MNVKYLARASLLFVFSLLLKSFWFHCDSSLCIRKPALENNRGADQSARPCNLIKTFVIHCLAIIIPLVVISAEEIRCVFDDI